MHHYVCRIAARLFNFASPKLIVIVFCLGVVVPAWARISKTTYAEHAMIGWASYYSQGRTTASGERFDPSALTAAHRTLPFGTRIVVTNLRTNESVTVRINDRGPFTGGRIVDLSYAAARALNMTGSGTEMVRLTLAQ